MGSTSSSGSRTWTHVVQETVQANRYVPLPADIETVVGTDHPLDGPSVFWNYERNSNYVVLSQRALGEPNYVDVGRYSIYDREDDGGADDARDGDTASDRGRIRPPDALNEVVRSRFVPGQRVAYLAYEEMVAGENGTAYLLTADQLLDLLPEDIDGDRRAEESGGFVDAILNAPGILPAP